MLIWLAKTNKQKATVCITVATSALFYRSFYPQFTLHITIRSCILRLQFHHVPPLLRVLSSAPQLAWGWHSTSQALCLSSLPIHLHFTTPPRAWPGAGTSLMCALGSHCPSGVPECRQRTGCRLLRQEGWWLPGGSDRPHPRRSQGAQRKKPSSRLRTSDRGNSRSSWLPSENNWLPSGCPQTYPCQHLGTEMKFISYLLPDLFPFSSSALHLPSHLWQKWEQFLPLLFSLSSQHLSLTSPGFINSHYPSPCPQAIRAASEMAPCSHCASADPLTTLQPVTSVWIWSFPFPT